MHESDGDEKVVDGAAAEGVAETAEPHRVVVRGLVDGDDDAGSPGRDAPEPVVEVREQDAGDEADRQLRRVAADPLLQQYGRRVPEQDRRRRKDAVDDDQVVQFRPHRVRTTSGARLLTTLETVRYIPLIILRPRLTSPSPRVGCHGQRSDRTTCDDATT